jgi:hypothetical protein
VRQGCALVGNIVNVKELRPWNANLLKLLPRVALKFGQI